MKCGQETSVMGHDAVGVGVGPGASVGAARRALPAIEAEAEKTNDIPMPSNRHQQRVFQALASVTE